MSNIFLQLTDPSFITFRKRKSDHSDKGSWREHAPVPKQPRYQHQYHEDGLSQNPSMFSAPSGSQVGNWPTLESSSNHRHGYHHHAQSSQHTRQGSCKYLDLKRVLTLPPGKAIHELYIRRDQLKKIMSSSSSTQQTLREIVNVLVHIIKVEKIGGELNEILEFVLSDYCLKGFILSLTRFIRGLPMIEDTEERKEIPNVLQAVIVLFDFLLTNYPPNKVVKYLPVDACVGTANQLSFRDSRSYCYQDINERAQQMLDRRNKMCSEVYECRAKLNVSSQSQSDEWTVALPTSDDLHYQPSVTPNIVDGEFPSVQEYLKIQRDLLREDFIIPFRSALKGSDEHSDKIFTDVRFYGEELVTSGETIHKVWFRPSQKAIDWETTKLLNNGNLVCFSNDGFGKIFYATVYSKQLKGGKFSVKLVSGEEYSLQNYKNLTMIESPGYFQGYAPIIEKLHKVVPDDLPFSQYLAKLQTTIDLPKYLRDARPILNLKGVVCNCEEGCLHQQVNILDLDSWKNLTPSTLDASQKDALYLALTHELALIQGPPGTGKSYVGLKAIQVLLQNPHLWRSSQGGIISKCPIMVVCYTNHALDQFLDGVIKLGLSKDDMVRLGGQYKDPKFEQFSLRWKVRQAHRQHKHSQPNIAMKSKALNEFISGDFTSDHCHQYCLFLSQEVIFDLQNYCEISFPFRCDDSMPLEFASWLSEDIQLESKALQSIDEERLDDEDFESQKLYVALGEEGFKNFIQKFKGVDPMKARQAHQYLKDHLHPPKSPDRLPLFKYCLNELLEIFQNQKPDKNQQLSNAMYKKETKDIKIRILQDAKVIGATTTAAARLSDLLSQVQSKILIVEEAAEVLEPHIIASLTQHTQHLILIGDHKQLRPKPTDYEFGTSHKLNISLFERLIGNGLPHATLKVQRRMRPEISRIVSEHVYDKKLMDHEKTKTYENVRGVKHNVYFINHDKEESPEDPDSKSHSNEHEATFIACLCKYLLYHGYKLHQITVVTSYKNQERKIITELRSKRITTDPSESDGEYVRVATIDNYQGEENDIILLSLVRSNRRKSVGFLKESNRVCVALSRARYGLYCIGNFQLFQGSCDFWFSVVDDLKSRNILGDSLELVCSRHKIVTKVSCADDFEQVPDGGCNLPCIAVYKDCGHLCPRKCHPDDKNHESPCQHPCPKLLPNCQHPCTKKCYEECDERCTKKVERELLCGHRQRVECYLDQFQSVRMCKQRCGAKLLCGHYCMGTCGTCYQGHLHTPCKQLCNKTFFCGHKCPGNHRCSTRCPPCIETCVYECSHSKCGTPCFSLCTPCDRPCSWRCQHSGCSKLCGEPCDDSTMSCSSSCNDKPCMKKLKCEHPCLGLLSERCPPVCHKCDTVKKQVRQIYSSDEVDESAKHRYIELKACKHVFSVQALDKWMELRKDEPIGWKCCPIATCRVPIMRALRYTRTINQIRHDINEVKRKETRYLSSCQRKQMEAEFSLLQPLDLIMVQFGGTPMYLDQETNDEELHKKYLFTVPKIEILDAKQLLIELQKNGCENGEIGSAKSLLLLQSQAKGFIEWTENNIIQLQGTSMLRLSDQMILDLTTEHKRLLLLLKCYRLQYFLSTKTDAEDQCEVLRDIQTICEDNSTKLSCEEYQAKMSKLKSIQDEHGVQIIRENEGNIISTLGLKADGWYKCTNGHYYNFNNTIDEYDGKCPECCLAQSNINSQAQAIEGSIVIEDSDSCSGSDDCIMII
jgi:hypothetical protein